MKKNLLSIAALAGVFLFTACSNDEDVISGGNDNATDASEITIALNPGGDGTTTRAIRPVGSSAAANRVEKVDLVIYKTADDGANWTKADTQSDYLPVSSLTWTAGPTGEGASTTDRYGSMKVKVQGLTAGDKYKIVAYGYNGNSVPFSSTDGTTASEFVTGIITTAGNNNTVEEIFAAEKVFTADADEKIPTADRTITMTRMVAGLIGYFEKVPVWRAGADGQIKQVAKIEVTACQTTTSFKFPYTATDGFNGVSSTAAEEVLLSYDLATLASDYNDQTTTGYTSASANNTYSFENNKAITSVPTGFASANNSIFGGRFLVPFSQTSTEQTLKVILKDADNNALKTFKVKTDKQQTEPATVYAYNILRNHFYSIGKKINSNNTTGGGEDPDKPVDLSVDTDLLVQLNDAWSVLHNMGVEE